MKKFREKIRLSVTKTFLRIKAYIRRFLLPLHLFPIKIITYSAYYLTKLTIKIFLKVLKLLWQTIRWPFRKWSHLFKTIFAFFAFVYFLFSLIVILDYIKKNYGHYSKFLCGYGLYEELNRSIVRVVGGYSEGSGFFIAEDQVVTNFHVIADEPSPKIIFSDGTFTTPINIVGDQNADLAVLYTKERYPTLVQDLMNPVVLYEEEPLVAAGYALGTGLKGKVTIQGGRFVAYRSQKKTPVVYIQTDINLVPGMSGGALVDKCGTVVGVNTIGLAGLSLFISSTSFKDLAPTFSDKEITKISVDPSKSPEEAVKAFYTFLKARRMEDGFNLLSRQYLEKTNFEEWTARFKDILDVEVYATKLEDEKRQLVFLKFSTSNWVDGEREEHYYEGTWQTVLEEGVYKMFRSNIKEIANPGWEWFYDL